MPNEPYLPGCAFLMDDISTSDGFIPEDFTNEHLMVRNAAVDFVRKEILPNEEQIETKDEKISRRLIGKAGSLGLNGTEVPVDMGGEALDKISTCLVVEAMGAAGSFGITHAIHTGIGMLPIAYFGNDQQKKKYLPKLCTGEWIGAYCLTEPGAGSDALNAATTAQLSEDGKTYILNGEKIFITNGSWADCYVVYAKVDGKKFSAFIVERDFDGIEPGHEEHKMGLGGSSTSSVIMKDCRVPVENVLYEIGKGHKIAFNILNIGRYKIGAYAIGASKVATTEAAKHAATRVQFGKPIGSFGMVQNKLAHMAMRTYMTESMIYRLAAMIDDRLAVLDERSHQSGAHVAAAIEEYAAECSIVKIYGSECLDFCVDEWVQILGGAGYTTEYPAERAYRNSRINRIVEGTNEINRLVVARTVIQRTLQGRLKPIEDFTSILSPKDPSHPLSQQAQILAMCKAMIQIVTRETIAKLGKTLADEQGVLEMLADMAMEIFAMDSGLRRAVKVIAKKGEKRARLHIAAVKAYLAEKSPQVDFWARQVLTYIDPDRLSDGSISNMSQMLWNCHVPTIAYKREIAERVIKSKKYIF